MGADDNATGVSALLEIARVLGQVELPRTVMVACWDEEEDGLVGSEAFAMLSAADGLVLDVVFNFDMIGFRSDRPNSQTTPAGLDLVFPEAYAGLEANEFRGDFVAVISNSTAAASVDAFTVQAERLGLRTALLGLPARTETDDLFADLRRSDHASFWDAGYPAIFLTDTSEFRNTHYHCANGPDVVADLDEDFAVAIARATAGAAAAAAGL
jgi:Zn-dependent M28 family amino/carboxypeptidase